MRRIGVFAAGDILTVHETQSDADRTAADVRGDFPNIDVATDVVWLHSDWTWRAYPES